MTKKDILDRLKEYKKKKVDISIPLNSPAIDLLNELQSLVKRNSTPSVYIEDGPLSLILLKLSINTIFRLYQSSSQVRRIVDAPNRIFWRKLIERDLGVVPKFKVDLKLHYLRILKVPIAGATYVPVKRYHGTFKKEHQGVVAMRGEATVNASGKVYSKKKKIYERQEGERIMWLEGLMNATMVITDQGCKIVEGTSGIDYDKIHGFKDLELNRLIHVWYPPASLALTKDGEVYFIRSNSMYKLNLPEPIIDCQFIDNDAAVLLSHTGILYRWTEDDKYDVKDIFAHQVQYIGYMNHRWIDFKGFIHDRIKYTKADAPPLAHNDIVLGITEDRYIDSHLEVKIISRKNDELIDVGFTNVLEYVESIRLLPSYISTNR